MVDVRRLTSRKQFQTAINLWNTCHPQVALDDGFAKTVIFQPPNAVSVTGLGAYNGDTLVGAVIYKHLTHSIPGYDDPDTGWISLFVVDTTRANLNTVGEQLLESVIAELQQRDITTLHYGHDIQKFVPGMPITVTDTYQNLFTTMGFGFDSIVADLHADVTTPSTQNAIADRLRRHDDSEAVARPVAADEERNLLDFATSEFNGRWAFQITSNCRLPGGRGDYWLIWANDNPVGFARTGTANSPVRTSCVAWREQLGNRLCGLGPIGVAADARSEGYGLYLIASVMDAFATDGYQHMTIDGVAKDLREYYAKLGFSPFREFRACHLEIGE